MIPAFVQAAPLQTPQQSPDQQSVPGGAEAGMGDAEGR